MRIATGAASAASDPTARALYEYFAAREQELQLEGAQVFFNFPLYRDDDRVVSCRLLLASPRHGLIVVGTSNAATGQQIAAACRDLNDTFSHIYARLFKNSRLKKGMRDLKVPAEAFLYAPDVPEKVAIKDNLDVPVTRSAPQAGELLNRLRVQPIALEDFEEALSTVEGAKGLIRPKERAIWIPIREPPASLS